MWTSLKESVKTLTDTVVPVSSTPAVAAVETSSSTPSYSPSPSPSSSSSTVTKKVTTTVSSTAYSTVSVVATPSSTPASSPAPAPTLPTAAITTFSTPGTYTIPARTVTVTSETTVCGATSTAVPSGTHTVGGVTTVVETATTITCPVATVKPSGSTVTSVIEQTTYVCPSAGTYTIAPITTYVPTSTVLVYPTPASFTPGTYTQPEQTVTVTDKDYTYVCPFSTGLPSSTPAAAAVTPTSTPVYTPAPISTPAASSTQSVSPAQTSATDDNGKIQGGKRYGITYSPYTSDGQCKSKSDVQKDIAEIKARGFNAVRIYSTDCNSLEYIGVSAEAVGLKLIVGVYIDQSGISAAQPQVDALVQWAKWNIVDLIVVGNEALMNGWVDVNSLAGFITSAKSAFQQSGYTGHITTAEPLNIWQQHGSVLCSAVTVVGGNVHPFFNSQVSPLNAGSFVKQQLDLLTGICPALNAPAINLETGWPHGGNANGLAVPGAVQQITALLSIANEAGDRSVFFSFDDDLWKQPGQFGVEQSWGCLTVFSILEPVVSILDKILSFVGQVVSNVGDAVENVGDKIGDVISS